MKPIASLAAVSLLAVTACVPRPQPAPPVQARPTPAPAPAPLPPPAPANWLDAPQTPGDWYYRGENGRTVAVFGGEATEGDFVIRCEPGTRAIVIMRALETPGPVAMRIRAETAARVLTARPDGSALPYVTASLAPGDRLLDAIALSKGRFAVEVAGAPTLYLPSWAEVTRVIEDCR